MEANSVTGLFGLLLLILFEVSANSAKVTENCVTDCNNDGTFPVCGAWLLEDNANKVSGIYQLKKGYLNLTCAIKSLPKLTDISWWYRNELSTKWESVSCASLHNYQHCGVTLDAADKTAYQVSSSTCMLKTDRLIKTGYYRCQGEDLASEQKNFIFSAETTVVVAGIEYFDVTYEHLPYGSMGHIEVMFCANPKPEVVWIVGDEVIRSGSGSSRISPLKLLPFKEWKPNNRQGSANIIPYCYRSGLVIGKVQSNDSSISVVIRNEGETRTFKLDSLKIIRPTNNDAVSNTMIPKLLYFLPLFALQLYFNKINCITQCCLPLLLLLLFTYL